jgi:hypothetical protein
MEKESKKSRLHRIDSAFSVTYLLRTERNSNTSANHCGDILRFLDTWQDWTLMQLLAPMFPTLAVATIYCLWFRANQDFIRRQRTLRERIAYMLWCAAHEGD